jgi:hypothetical protein
MRYWTDQKIRVHVFYTVFALIIAHLMRRTAEHAGLRPLPSASSSANCPASARPSCSATKGGKGRPRAQRLLTGMTDTQRRLHDLFDLRRYAPHPLTPCQWVTHPALPAHAPTSGNTPKIKLAARLPERQPRRAGRGRGRAGRLPSALERLNETPRDPARAAPR